MKKKRTFDGKTFVLDRTGSHKKALQKIGESGKKNKAIKSYRIVKDGRRYEFYIRPLDKMTTIKLFDSEYCESIDCPRYSYWFGGICYGMPENCKKNNKHGYPKEVKNE